MNLSAAIMLVDKTVRPVRVEYDPDNKYNNNPMFQFKTIDPAIKVGDLVIVQTNTRYGFTICKVVEIDYAVDFHDPRPWGWIGGKFDKEGFDNVLKIEEGVKSRVAKAEENKMRQEIINNMGLGDVSFDDIQLRRLSTATIDGVDPDAKPEPAPTPTPAPQAP